MAVPYPRACAINAAGIADRFRAAQCADHDGDNRMRDISMFANGWLGIAKKLGEAGEIMERLRLERGPDAKWGGELPHSYDVWHGIGLILWHNFENSDIEGMARLAVAIAAAGHFEDDSALLGL